jgi:hypothetical protein
MALTYQQALEEAKRQQSSVGAKGAIDDSYVKALMGQNPTYTQDVLKTVQPTRQVAQVTEKTGSSLSDNLAEAQRKQRISQLEQAYKRSIGALSAEQQALEPRFQEQTRQASAQNLMAGKRYEDLLAERGLAQSGMAGQGELARSVALQGQMGNIQSQRQQVLSDLERRRTEAEQNRAYGEEQALAEIEQQSIQNRIAQESQERQRAEQTQNLNMDLFGQTIGRYSDNYQQEINNLLAQGVPQDDYRIAMLQAARQQKIQGQQQTAYEQAQAQQDMQRQAYEDAVAKWTKGIPLSAYEQQILGVTSSTKPKSTSGGSTVKQPLW